MINEGYDKPIDNPLTSLLKVMDVHETNLLNFASNIFIYNSVIVK